MPKTRPRQSLWSCQEAGAFMARNDLGNRCYSRDSNTPVVPVHADLALKEQALARTTPPGTAPGRYHPPDKLLAFLEAL